MLDRAIEYAKLHKGGKGMSPSDIEEKYGENYITVCKLIRLGEAPKSVIKMIRSKKVSATTVLNTLKASMTPEETIEMVNNLVKEREEAHTKLEELGYKGGTSVTLKRALQMAIDNLKKRHLVKTAGRKSIIGVLNSIVNNEEKPTVESIEKAILSA